MEPESKILIISQANVAVDNVLRGLPPMGVPQKKIVRCGNDEKISDDMKDFSLDKQVTLYNKSFSQLCRPDLQPYRKIWRSMMQSSKTQDLVGEYLLKNFSERIAVITPYRNQNRKLQQRLHGERLKKVVVIAPSQAEKFFNSLTETLLSVGEVEKYLPTPEDVTNIS